MTDARSRLLLAALADLLSYPAGAVAEAARQARAIAGSGEGAGAWSGALARFCEHVEATDLAAMQELYTATFDLQPACAPYFGHQLLGDSPLRGPLLAKLAEIYGAERFAPREELADHVAEVLRFLSVARPGDARDELVTDGVVPSLCRMLEAFPDHANPYRDLLVAVHALLADPGSPTGVAPRREVLT